MRSVLGLTVNLIINKMITLEKLIFVKQKLVKEFSITGKLPFWEECK